MQRQALGHVYTIECAEPLTHKNKVAALQHETSIDVCNPVVCFVLDELRDGAVESRGGEIRGIWCRHGDSCVRSLG